MKHARFRLALLLLLTLVVAIGRGPALAQSTAVANGQEVAVEQAAVAGDEIDDAAAPKALDHDAYDIWKGIEGEALSRNGLWALYQLTLQDGDPDLRVRSLTGDTEYSVPRGTGARFDAGSRYVVAKMAPELEVMRQAKREKAEDDDLPKAGLAILDLASGAVTEIERVKSFALAEDGGDWVAIHLEKEPVPEAEPEPAPEDDEDETKEEKKPGTALLLRQLTDETETRFEGVVAYGFTKDGRRFAFATSTEDGEGDGVFVIDLNEDIPAAAAALAGEGNYGSLAFDDSGDKLAFLTDRDDFESDPTERTLYLWEASTGAAEAAGEARPIAASGTAGIAGGWWVSEHQEPQFSSGGGRLFFGTAPRPTPEPDDDRLDEEKVRVDIWNWKDPLLQPMQLLQAEEERKRTYIAVAHLGAGAPRIVQLATSTIPEIDSDLYLHGDDDVVLASSRLLHQREISWDSPEYVDHYLIDVETGLSRALRRRGQGPLTLSPSGRYATWWDNRERAWFGLDLREVQADGNRAGGRMNLTEAIPHAVHDEEHDEPSPPRPYGAAG